MNIKGFYQAGVKKLSGLNFYLLLAFAFVVPLLTLPALQVPFQFSKTFVAIVLVVLMVITLATHVLKSGALSFRWSLLLGSVSFLPLAYLVVSLFSKQPSLSFFGYQLESDTFGFILFGAVMVFAIVHSSLSRTRIFSIIGALFASAGIIFLFQLMQVIFGAPFPALFSNNPSINLIGSWNDFGIFSGLTLILSLLSFEMLKMSKKMTVAVLLTIVVSGFFAVLVNSTEVWILIGITASAALVHALMGRFILKKEGASSGVKKNYKGLLSGVVLALALFSVFVSGPSLLLQETFNISNAEVRPSLQGTLSVLTGVYAAHPVFGSGPNTFASQWLMYRPDSVLQSPFWNTTFSSGNGFIPGALATGGILIAIAWIFFLCALLFTSVKALLFSSDIEERSYYLVVFTALGSLYLAVSHVLYPPSQLLTIIFFLFIGLFISSLSGTRMVRTMNISFADAPRFGFVAVFLSVLLIAASLGALYNVGVTYASSIYNSHSVALSNAGNLDGAFDAELKAVALRPQDRYYRTLAALDFARLNALVNSGDSDAEAQGKFQTLLARSLENSNKAIAINPQNSQNVFLKALIYSAIIPLKIDGAYAAAVTTYEQVRPLNPKSPEIDFRLAQAHVVGGTKEQVASSIEKALAVRPNYTDAILLRAQTELDNGELNTAIASVRAAVYFEPQNSVLLYQLGLLLLENKSYTDAAEAFEVALSIEPNFANAAFFLAHAYAFIDKKEDAIQLLTALKVNNPDNETVTTYLAAMKDGKNPFNVGAVSPEKDSELE